MGQVTLATKTIAKIDAMVQKDQGSAYRGWLGKVIGHISDAYDTSNDAHRSHLGASVIGTECGRALFYNFRWATKANFEGRMLRLFNRGHLEEARFIALLLMIGVEVYQQDANGKQYRISTSEGHVGGSGDGVLIGVPDVPAGTAILGEFKTHAEKSFILLKDKGVRDAKFEHYVQMNLYMRKMGLPAALYLAVNKNTDELYGEIVMLDATTADQFFDRADKVVWMDKPPSKLNASPGFYKCRFCDHRPVCHLGTAPDRNCRTCKFSQPVENAEWRCSLDSSKLDKQKQLKGCDKYEVRDM